MEFALFSLLEHFKYCSKRKTNYDVPFCRIVFHVHMHIMRILVIYKLQKIGFKNKNIFTLLYNFAVFQEIYPPKLADFAYVTDGACSENEILDQELIMLKVCF